MGDFECAVDFYGACLGLPLKFKLPAIGIAGFKLGPEEPGLFIRAGATPEQPPRESPRLWLEVADARLADQLRERGLEPLADAFEVTTGWTVELAGAVGQRGRAHRFHKSARPRTYGRGAAAALADYDGQVFDKDALVVGSLSSDPSVRAMTSAACCHW